MMDDIHSAPGHLIRRAHQISTALFTEECAKFDLTAVQYAALRAIGATPGIDATRLSALIAFDRSTIGDVLDRLEQKGWIARQSALTDRRIKTIELSAHGRTLLHQVEPAVERVQERILAPLAPPDRDRFIALLQQLANLHGDTIRGS